MAYIINGILLQYLPVSTLSLNKYEKNIYRNIIDAFCNVVHVTFIFFTITAVVLQHHIDKSDQTRHDHETV